MRTTLKIDDDAAAILKAPGVCAAERFARIEVGIRGEVMGHTA